MTLCSFIAQFACVADSAVIGGDFNSQFLGQNMLNICSDELSDIYDIINSKTVAMLRFHLLIRLHILVRLYLCWKALTY